MADERRRTTKAVRAMPKFYSGDLRQRVIEAVEPQASRREAEADHVPELLGEAFGSVFGLRFAGMVACARWRYHGYCGLALRGKCDCEMRDHPALLNLGK
jgi:hypothetical protein